MVDGLDVKAAREAAGLTQADAARAARISVATWRRAEDDPSSVSAKTRAAVERVLKTSRRKMQGKAREEVEIAEHVRRLNACFGVDGSALTPATAAQLAVTSDSLQDLDGQDWSEASGMTEQLSQAVLFRVYGNQAWLKRLGDTFEEMAVRIGRGAWPWPRTMADEFVLHTSIEWGRGTWDDMPPWEYLNGLERRADDGDWRGVMMELSHFPLGFPDLAEDEMSSRVTDGRVYLSRLHPYRWWEPLEMALEEWRAASPEGVASPGFITRMLFDFLKINRGVVDEIFEGDLYGCDLDVARNAVLLRDASGFTAVLNVAHPDDEIRTRDDPLQAQRYAYAFLQHLFLSREEQLAAKCGACGKCDECDLGDPLSDDVEGRKAWRRSTGLLAAPMLVNGVEIESSGQAIGIKFNDEAVIRVTIVNSS
ncbi:helix-turn-helix transcriptional regulator [Actinoallomurus sp. NBC_01490]|uniref:helix-turn-helix domain-containing protein n=1 Tax=Actinoallomurus sp. NBC_01490 TaxID=2903557 RepID=UPI002E3214ED|nr:helix-turn-helix transcriptional regulator [Actinoallomurus sp. NBC_01490]